MKNKIFLSIMTFVMALLTVSCSDDNYTPTNPMLDDNSVVTGTADVTPTTATLKGSVTGLEGQSGSAYKVGFYYAEANADGSCPDNLSETVEATSGSEFSAVISGTPTKTFYYQAFVTLQGHLTYTGKIESCILTDAKAFTGEFNDLTANSVKLSGSAEKYTETSKMGIAISGVGLKSDGETIDVDKVRKGVKIQGKPGDTYDISALGLVPNTTYYYVAYVDLGGGQVYGEVKSFTTPAKFYDMDNDFVDLGLSTNWAKCNIGAEKETDLGGHFGFGDLTGFNTSIDPADYASDNIYGTPQDLASKVYDQKATVPTVDEIEELFNCCNVEWTTVDGVAGYKFTSKVAGYEGNSIFLPAAGSRIESDTTNVGIDGRYLTGTINPTDHQYADTYLFNASGHGRSTTPVYQAVSVRAVTVQKRIPLDKSKLFRTWEIDINSEGNSVEFAGPITFYGANASWRSIVNKEQTYQGGVDWAPSFSDVNWYIGSDPSVCQGYITFNEDGTCEVKDAEGNITTGTYILDEDKKTIQLVGVEMLKPTTMTNVDFSTIRILSIANNKVILSGSRQGDGEQVALNMVTAERKNGFTAKLKAMNGRIGCDEVGTTTVYGDITGQYTVTLETTTPRSYGSSYYIDIEGFAEKYPNAIVVVDKIEADGAEIPFDANKFYYGDIKDNGNFRIELFDIYGKTGDDTPFSKNGGCRKFIGESALAFETTFSVTFSVVSLDELSYNVKQTVVGSNWGGNWGKEFPGAVKVYVDSDTHKLVLKAVGEDGTLSDDVSVTMNASDCGYTPNTGMVCLFEIPDLCSSFPGTSAVLESVENDGTSLTWDASKILYGDLEGAGNFRVELFNTWGESVKDPAFDGMIEDGGNKCIPSLGFSTSSTYTVSDFKLFALPDAWK